jgi:Ca-activated chloride channel family protein
MFRSWTLIGGIAAACSIVAALAGQQGAPDDPGIFRSGSSIVSVFATVVTSDNRLVTDLTQDDFEILEDGKPQPIVVFSNEPQPISVVVMLDTSGSMTANIKLLKEAAEQFVLRLLPADKAKVGVFHDRIEYSAAFTSDRDSLIAEIRDFGFGNGTRLNDALAISLDELYGLEGRRVALVFTDGQDTSSRANFRTIVDRARLEDVMVYSIGLESEYFDGTRMVRSRPEGALRRLAEETGGGYFELTRTSDLSRTFTRVAQELHSQYVLGFEALRADGRVHTLAVRLKRPGLTARARRSYVAAQPAARQEPR